MKTEAETAAASDLPDHLGLFERGRAFGLKFAALEIRPEATEEGEGRLIIDTFEPNASGGRVRVRVATVSAASAHYLEEFLGGYHWGIEDCLKERKGAGA